MIDTFKNLWHLLLLRGRRSSSQSCAGTLAHPKRDWTFILVACILLCIVIVLFDANVYLSTASPKNTSLTGVAPAPAGPSEENLSQILSYYQQLHLDHQALLQSEPTIVDPAKSR